MKYKRLIRLDLFVYLISTKVALKNKVLKPYYAFFNLSRKENTNDYNLIILFTDIYKSLISNSG